ncbi:MAG: copper chaperone PCu(A)C [Tahibacter sp.]
MRNRISASAILLSLTGVVQAAGTLHVEGAWIRAMPSGAPMQAGYAVLHNVGDEALSVVSASSVDYANVSLHQTVEENGMTRMRPIEHLDIAGGQGVVLEPGGRHLMLMMPHRELPAGANATITFALQDGSTVTATFVVADAMPEVAPPAAPPR